MKYSIFLLLALLVASCAKRPLESKLSEKHFDFKSAHVFESIERNLPVSDHLQLYFPMSSTGKPDCDSICDRHLQNQLMRLNMEKRSGDNKYEILYDRYQRVLKINVHLAETVNRKKESDTAHYNFKETIEIQKIPVIVPVPKWIKVLAWIGGFSILFWVYRIIRIFT